MKNKMSRVFLALVLFAAMSLPAFAGTDATTITDAATTAWTGVAGLCVVIGTFVVVYRLVKKIK